MSNNNSPGIPNILLSGKPLSLLEQRYFIELSFKGTAYNGWQMQPNAPSVQQTTQDALSLLLKEKIRLTGAGRTDTGVHASYFVAHFICKSNLPEPAAEIVRKLNHMLPHDIAIISIFPVRPNNHSRFSALSRTYKYYISRKKDPFRQETSYHLSALLDVNAMNRAAEELIKHNDFRSFCRTNSSVKTHICHIEYAGWEEDDNMLIFTIKADRFLRNMVRAIVGTMLDIGCGKLSETGFRKVIEARDRRRAGTSAPAQGLFLTGIEYPDGIFNLCKTD
ncbi:MAG: tRNA pseudouridine(38-40) synthase TruA [Bacteroidales bacterium]